MGELKKWREEKWVRITTSGDIAGACGTSKNKSNPDRCLPLAKARSMSKAERAATAKRKKKYGRKKQFVSNTKKGRVTKKTYKTLIMAIINTYSSDSTIEGADKLIGSDGTSGADAGKTKNYTVSALTSYVASNLSGTIKMTGLTNAADDSAAATAGVAVGQVYRNGSVLRVRVS